MAHMNESWHFLCLYFWGREARAALHVVHTHESCLTCERVMAHMNGPYFFSFFWGREARAALHVLHTHGTCLIYEYVKAHMNESWHFLSFPLSLSLGVGSWAALPV